METFFLVIIALALCSIIATVGAVFYSYIKTKISREPSFQESSSLPKNVLEAQPLLREEKKHNVRPSLPGLYVLGVSSLSLLLVFLAAERGVPVTLVVSKDPGSLALAFPRNVADFVKRNYACESVHDMIAALPESVVVVPEETLVSLPETGIRVEAPTIKDPFFMADELCGKSDAVILVKRSCSNRKQDEFEIL
jgi:hypothetical protein